MVLSLLLSTREGKKKNGIVGCRVDWGQEGRKEACFVGRTVPKPCL